MTFLLNKNTKCIKIAVLGATGLLGQEMIKAMALGEATSNMALTEFSNTNWALPLTMSNSGGYVFPP